MAISVKNCLCKTSFLFKASLPLMLKVPEVVQENYRLL